MPEFQPPPKKRRKNTTENPTEEQIYEWCVKHARAIAGLYRMNEREEKGGRKCEVRRSKNWFVVEIFEFDTWNGRNKWRRYTIMCYVDKKTGEVYKDKSGKVCYDLRILGDREFLFDPKNETMRHGSYVYAKAVKKYRRRLKDYV